MVIVDFAEGVKWNRSQGVLVYYNILYLVSVKCLDHKSLITPFPDSDRS